MSLSGVASIASDANGIVLATGCSRPSYRPAMSVYQAGSSGGSGMSLGVLASDGSIAVWNPSYNSGAMSVARLTFTYLKE